MQHNFQKLIYLQLAIASVLILSATCTVLHQPLIPLAYRVQYHDTPNYNFAYEVNDGQTGDIKSQHESRRGETVLGQYSLLQPDGVRRTVDYTADEQAGFRAIVNNEGRPQEQVQVNEAQRSNMAPDNLAYVLPASTTPSPTPAPAVAVSRSSIVQTFYHGHPWL